MKTNSDKYEQVLRQIDQYNRQDPNLEQWQGHEYPKELLYAQRMSDCLNQFAPNASESLKIAARAHHIGRWKIPRTNYPMDRKGYLHWRNELKSMHARITSEILKTVGYDSQFIDNVSDLIQKKNLKKNPNAQTLEDVICLVFLQFYLGDFSEKKDDQKIIEILRKTWRKMSPEGHQAALKLALPTKVSHLIEVAMGSA